MRHRRFRASCACVISITTIVIACERAASADSRELFIGNSLTLTNNLPALVGQMRSFSGAPLDYSQGTAATFGMGLDWHWTDTSPQGAQAQLAQGGWDGVVLQDVSLNATDNPTRTRTYVPLWDNQIKQKSPGATTFLYAHWERQDRAGSQPIIDSLYSSLGSQLDATVVPAGDTWARLKEVRPDIPLYTDVVHPTLPGSYAAAATFYATFYGQSPVGFAPPPGLNATDALAIQNAAWDVVSGRLTAVDRSWASAATGDWNDPGNWSMPAVPAAGDRVSLGASDGANHAVNYVSANGASTLLGSLNISAASGSMTLQQNQGSMRVAGDLVLGDSSGGSGNYELSGTGRIFAARDEQVVNGSFIQHGGRHIVMQKLSVGGGNASYLLDGGLLSANTVEVDPGGTFTQQGGMLQSGIFNLAGGTVLGTLHNRGLFNYSAGTFHGKLIDEGLAVLSSNAGKIGATGGALPQMDVEVSGDDSSLVTATTNQDLRSLVVNYQNDGQQGFDLASSAGPGAYRSVRIFPPDAASLAASLSSLQEAIANALENPGDGIFDSGLDGRAGDRIGLARQVDASQNTFLLMRPTVIGDLNLDGTVSISDFIDLASNFNASNASWDMGDLNYDGNVSISDFIDLAANFGGVYSGDAAPLRSIASIPEPSHLLFLGVLVLAMTTRFRGATAKSPSTSAADEPADN